MRGTGRGKGKVRLDATILRADNPHWVWGAFPRKHEFDEFATMFAGKALYYDHDYERPVGKITRGYVSDEGHLNIEAEMDLDEDNIPVADMIFSGKAPCVSFASKNIKAHMTPWNREVIKEFSAGEMSIVKVPAEKDAFINKARYEVDGRVVSERAFSSAVVGYKGPPQDPYTHQLGRPHSDAAASTTLPPGITMQASAADQPQNQNQNWSMVNLNSGSAPAPAPMQGQGQMQPMMMMQLPFQPQGQMQGQPMMMMQVPFQPQGQAQQMQGQMMPMQMVQQQIQPQMQMQQAQASYPRTAEGQEALLHAATAPGSTVASVRETLKTIKEKEAATTGAAGGVAVAEQKQEQKQESMEQQENQDQDQDPAAAAAAPPKRARKNTFTTADILRIMRASERANNGSDLAKRAESIVRDTSGMEDAMALDKDPNAFHDDEDRRMKAMAIRESMTLVASADDDEFQPMAANAHKSSINRVESQLYHSMVDAVRGGAPKNRIVGNPNSMSGMGSTSTTTSIPTDLARTVLVASAMETDVGVMSRIKGANKPASVTHRLSVFADPDPVVRKQEIRDAKMVARCAPQTWEPGYGIPGVYRPKPSEKQRMGAFKYEALTAAADEPEWHGKVMTPEVLQQVDRLNSQCIEDEKGTLSTRDHPAFFTTALADMQYCYDIGAGLLNSIRAYTGDLESDDKLRFTKPTNELIERRRNDLMGGANRQPVATGMPMQQGGYRGGR